MLNMCEELKPRSGPEGAGLPGTAMGKARDGLATCGLCHVLLPGREREAEARDRGGVQRESLGLGSGLELWLGFGLG